MTNTILIESCNPSSAKKFLEEELLQQDHNYISLNKDNFSMADALEIQNLLLLSGVKVFLFARSLGVEAQNALLKITEDLSKESMFVLAVPKSELLLETLRSRFVLYKLAQNANSAIAEDFCKLSQKEKLAKLSKMSNEELDELLSSFEEYLRKDLESNLVKIKRLLSVKKQLANSKAFKKGSLEFISFLC